MSRAEALELLVKNLCTTGLQHLRHPRLPGARAAHRKAIFDALASLQRPPSPAPQIQEPPVWLDAPERVGPAPAAAPDYWWLKD